MFKKISVFLLSLAVLAGILFFYYNPSIIGLDSKMPADKSELELHKSQEQENSETTVSKEVAEASKSKTVFRDEKIVGASDYPVSSVTPELTIGEIQPALDKYYQEQFSEKEKMNSQEELSEDSLTNIQSYIDQNADLSQLNAKVDQVSLEVADTTVYVPRIVVASTFKEADSTVSEHDIQLGNLMLSEVGNRLVLLAYYNEETKQVIPYNLTTGSTPLFYNDKAAETSH